MPLPFAEIHAHLLTCTLVEKKIRSITSTGTDIFLFGGSQRGIPKGDLFVIDSGKHQGNM